jgi:hypothetical protein
LTEGLSYKDVHLTDHRPQHFDWVPFDQWLNVYEDNRIESHRWDRDMRGVLPAAYPTSSQGFPGVSKPMMATA